MTTNNPQTMTAEEVLNTLEYQYSSIMPDSIKQAINLIQSQADEIESKKDIIKEHTPRCECCEKTAYPLANVMGDMVCWECISEELQKHLTTATEGLEAVKKHQETIAPTAVKFSATWNIADKTLAKIKGEGDEGEFSEEPK